MRTPVATVVASLALVANVACSRGRARERPGAAVPADGATGLASQASPGRDAGPPPDGAGAPASALDCREPCLLLDDHPIDEVRAACPAWPAAGVTPRCDDLDHARNCVYAAHGHVFAKDRWRKAFAATSWYRPDPGFRASSLPRVAVANVAQLRREGGFCRAKVDARIAPDNRAAVDAWFAELAAGRVPPVPELPARDDDGGPASFSRDLLVDLRRDDPRWGVRDPWEPLVLSEAHGDRQVIEVDVDEPDPASCRDEDEECEGSYSLQFHVRAGRILGITYFAAACPFVYQPDGAGGWLRRGEILRNLRRPEDEATQTLALTGECGAVRRVRLTEEKRERTFLDSVALVVDGVAVPPLACGELCAEDDRYQVLTRGAVLDLTFELPAASCAPATLVANGHYVPDTAGPSAMGLSPIGGAR